MWNRKKIGMLLVALFIIAGSFGAGFYFGLNTPAENKILNVLHKDQPIQLREQVDFSLFWQAWNILENKYVDIGKVKRQEMLYGAISGLLKSMGDPYTIFLSPKDLKEFEIEIKGEFHGVGMEIGLRKEVLTVIAPLKDTPADRAGILAGDRILKINDTATFDMSVEEAVQLIRGPKGTKVKLTILRNGEDENRVIEIERDVIKIPVLDTEGQKTVISEENGQKKEVDLGNIFIIRLHSFSENSTTYFRQALREMDKQGKSKLILDLRNNPGGFLDSAVDIASWFLPQGETVVIEDYGAKEEQKIHRSRGYNTLGNIQVIVLVNQGSASASEILAGALQDHGKAKIIGERTFGKGSVQELVPLTSDTSLKITVAKWLTPTGKSISDGGLTPDTEIKPTKEDAEAKRDVVLEKAIEMLKNQ